MEKIDKIIRETIEQIISEDEVNELSPETLERYADGRAKQGKFFKSWMGHKAARQGRRNRGENIPLVRMS
jgi:hypothetical protein